MPPSPDGRWSSTKKWIAGVAGTVVATLIAALILGVIDRDDSERDASKSAQSATKGGLEPTTTTTTPTTTHRSPTSTLPKVIRYLADEDDDLNPDVYPESGQQKIGNEDYLRSVWVKVGTCPNTLELWYDLEQQASTFESVVGVSNDTFETVRVQVEILLDGVQAPDQAPFIVALKNPQPVKIDVEGTLRLKLRMTVLGPRPADTCYYELHGDLVWGDARLTLM